MNPIELQVSMVISLIITMKLLQNKKTCQSSLQLDDIEKFFRLFSCFLEHKTEANVDMWWCLKDLGIKQHTLDIVLV